MEERVTLLPWLWSVLDVDSSPEVYARYDRMSAKELFQRFLPAYLSNQPMTSCAEELMLLGFSNSVALCSDSTSASVCTMSFSGQLCWVNFAYLLQRRSTLKQAYPAHP